MAQSRNSISDRALADTLKAVLQHGMVINMHTLDNGPKQITLTLANNNTELHWKSVKLFSRKSYKLSLHDVLCVEVGKRTSAFLSKSSTHAAAVSEDLCVSIVTQTHTLDLVASTKVERDVFVDGLNSILNELKRQKAYQV
jgi:predicted ATPase